MPARPPPTSTSPHTSTTSLTSLKQLTASPTLLARRRRPGAPHCSSARAPPELSSRIAPRRAPLRIAPHCTALHRSAPSSLYDRIANSPSDSVRRLGPLARQPHQLQQACQHLQQVPARQRHQRHPQHQHSICISNSNSTSTARRRPRHCALFCRRLISARSNTSSPARRQHSRQQQSQSQVHVLAPLVPHHCSLAAASHQRQPHHRAFRHHRHQQRAPPQHSIIIPSHASAVRHLTAKAGSPPPLFATGADVQHGAGPHHIASPPLSTTTPWGIMLLPTHQRSQH